MSYNPYSSEENILKVIEQYIGHIFGSEVDEKGVLFGVGFHFELNHTAKQIDSILTEDVHTNESELGHILKYLFVQTFGSSINLDNDLYIEMASVFLHEQTMNRLAKVDALIENSVDRGNKKSL